MTLSEKRLPASIVLTAGLGTRLDPLTRLLAKPAVPLAGRTLIERVLGWLAGQGVTDVILNLHHLPETITSITGDGAQLGLGVRYSWESPILGSAGGPRRAFGLLDEDTAVIVNGDTLCEFDLRAMLDAHDTARADVTMALVPNPAPQHYNGVLMDDSGRVTGFVPKGQASGSWHFIGVQIARASVFAGLDDGVPAETVAGIYRAGIAEGRLHVRGFAVDQPFLDVGTARDYHTAALTLAQTPADLVGTGCPVDGTARLDRTVVWPGSSVDANAVLEECIVAGVALPAGFAARRTVLVPAHVCRPGDPASIAGDIAAFRF
jgi:mannose-1-phosphate guanylyltransferase